MDDDDEDVLGDQLDVHWMALQNTWRSEAGSKKQAEAPTMTLQCRDNNK